MIVVFYGYCNIGYGFGLIGKLFCGVGLLNIMFIIMIIDGFILCLWIYFKEFFEIYNIYCFFIIEIVGYFNLKKLRRRIRI